MWRDRPEPGGARGSRSQGSNHCRRELAQGTGARGPAGGRRRRGSPGIAGVRDPPSTCSPEWSGGRRGGRCVGGDRSGGARNGRLASVCRPAHLEAGMRQGKPGGLEFCSLGPRLWLPGLCSWLSATLPYPLSGKQAFHLPAPWPTLPS